MRPDIYEEAIRTIVQEGICPDFVDVSNVVQKRFGLNQGWFGESGRGRS